MERLFVQLLNGVMGHRTIDGILGDLPTGIQNGKHTTKKLLMLMMTVFKSPLTLHGVPPKGFMLGLKRIIPTYMLLGFLMNQVWK